MCVSVFPVLIPSLLGACRRGPWSEWSECMIIGGACTKRRSQEKIEPNAGDHDLIPYRENCAEPAIEYQSCDESLCNAARILRSLGRL